MTIRIIRDPALGRVVVPDPEPADAFVFWTTADFDGALTPAGREKILSFARERAGSTRALATCAQVHGATALRATHSRCGETEEACDALWTDDPSISLGTKVADCLPVTLIDSGNRIAAGIHAGWRGATQRIVSRTLGALPRQASPSTRIFLGPSIRSCCFEVGREVVDAFRDSHGSIDAHIRERGERNPLLDLAGIVTDELIEHGFAASQIHDTGLCTRCDGSIFHSYRRSGPRVGRNLAIAGMKDV
ncbi:MAG: polyphenol oxidase family protein [Acidobacteria bacterium]|nr:polyphenol oxidase family protein [Acidobacteriota bacterium]